MRRMGLGEEWLYKGIITVAVREDGGLDSGRSQWAWKEVTRRGSLMLSQKDLVIPF